MASSIRSREFLAVTKCQLSLALSYAVNASNNNFNPKGYDLLASFMKFFVGRGNNHNLVKAILRQRLQGNWT